MSSSGSEVEWLESKSKSVDKNKKDKKKKKKKEKKSKKKKKKSRKRKGSNDDVAVVADSLLRRPMTMKEFEEKRNKVRKVVDEETGRVRLIRGDGEILEEIVSRSRHQEINRMATLHDGLKFSSTSASKSSS